MINPGAPAQVEPEIADPNEKPPKPPRKYKEFPLTKEEERKYRGQQSEIRRILMAKKFNGNQAKFDEFISRYFLGRWTLWDNRTALPNYRKDLRNYFGQTKSGQVYDHLNALALDILTKVANDDYNPAARINAMFAVGELNTAEPTGSEPAVPLPDALKVLIDTVNSDLPDAVRVAAMVGAIRHAEAGIRDAGAQRSLTDAMLRLATADPPTGPTAAGREWILAQAVETLGLLGSPGDGNNVFKALVGIVSDARLSSRTRSIAAAALGKLNYTGASGIDPLDAAAKLGRFAADSCAEEARLSKDAGKPVAPCRVKQRLESLLTALNGADDKHKGLVSLARQPDQQALLAELQKSVKELNDRLDAPGSEGKDFGKPVEELSQKLEAWLEKQKGG